MFLILCFFLLPNVCGGCLCSGGFSGTGGVDFVLEDVSKTLFLLCCLVCVEALWAVGTLAGLVAWIVCWRMFPILCYFMFPSMCCGSVCSGGSSASLGLDCVLKDVFNTVFFCCLMFGGCVCSGGASGTGSVDFVLDDISNTM